MSRTIDSPKQSSKRVNATNQAYFAYANKGQRRYVKSRTPVVVRKRVKKASTALANQPVLKVAECTAHYLKTLLDPFDSPAGACLPADMFPLPSQKLKTFLRGTCVLGTTGFGYINGALVLSSDTIACSATTVTSVMASNTTLSTVTNLANFSYAQLPWTAANVAANLVQGRGVALGLRVRYSGTESARNGTATFFEDPDHISTGGLTYDTVRQRVNAYSCRPSGDGSWDTVLYSGPVTPNEVEFRNSDYLSVNGATVLCVIKGIAGDTYDFELFQHIEAIGVNTSGKTPSHSDSVNYGKAQETAKNESGIKSLSVSDGPSVISQFIHKVVELAPFVIQQGSNVVKALGGNPMALLEGMASSAGLIVKSAMPRAYPAIQSRAMPLAITQK